MKLSKAIQRTKKVLSFMNDHSLTSFQDSDAVQVVIEAAERLEKLIQLEIVQPLPVEQTKDKKGM